MSSFMVEAVAAFDAVAGSPDRDNPYRFDGQVRMPGVVHRTIDTPSRLSEVIQSTIRYRELRDDDVISEAGISSESFRLLRDEGQGTVHDALLLLRAIGVNALTLPPQLEG